jgi:hypothetical protein
MSYNNEGVWSNLAAVAEIYDLDICGGHSTQTGTYHRHQFSACLLNDLSDNGKAHSPLYGFAADGYPVYGPYVEDGSLAKSCWQVRDYDSHDSDTGCGGGGARSCLLVDNFDLSKGSSAASRPGPNTTGISHRLQGIYLMQFQGLILKITTTIQSAAKRA